MRRFVAGSSLASLLLIASACEQPEDQAEVRDSVAATADSVLGSATGERAAAADHEAARHAAAEAGGQALLPIMQRLGSEMTTLTHALMTDDYQTVERSAGAIAEHAPISAEELERIHSALGSDMARFEAVDESVHVASVRLHEAAQARQPVQIAERLGEVQRGCVSCHVQFRERLVVDRAAR